MEGEKGEEEDEEYEEDVVGRVVTERDEEADIIGFRSCNYPNISSPSSISEEEKRKQEIQTKTLLENESSY